MLAMPMNEDMIQFQGGLTCRALNNIERVGIKDSLVNQAL